MAAKLRRVVITGIGIVSPFGIGKEILFESLVKNKSALQIDKELNAIVGRIPKKEAKYGLDLSNWEKSGEVRRVSRGTLLAMIAAEEAIHDSGLQNSNLREMGVNVGMGIADLEFIAEISSFIKEGKPHKVTPYFVPRVLTNMPAGYISIRYGMQGPNLSSSTACATGLNAIGDASTFISMGRADWMIAGATEACINPITVVGFQRLRAISSRKSCPFDSSRDGFGLSEGAGLVVLERLDSALKRGANIYAEINGYGVAGDAFHLTATSENGIGATLSMRRSIKDAGFEPSSITYVNAHATSTPRGDRAEANAIASLLPGVAVSSIKGHIGHSLAAAGAIETAVVAMCIKEGILIGNANLKETEITSNVRLLREAEQWTSKRRALINSFGFGGPHATLCISHYPSL